MLARVAEASFKRYIANYWIWVSIHQRIAAVLRSIRDSLWISLARRLRILAVTYTTGVGSSDAPGFPPGSDPAGETGEISVFTLLNACLRHRRLMFWPAAIGLAMVIGHGLLSHRTYASTSTFVPQTRDVPSALAGLSGFASQFGFTLPAGGAAESPAFYADLLQSRALLDSVIVHKYILDSSTSSSPRDLIQIYEITGANHGLQLWRARKRLTADVNVTIRQKTGVVVLTVQAPAAALATEINALLLRLVNRFNLNTRKSQASAERVFTETRLDEVKTDLRAAEDRLELFLQQNRDYRNSPALSFQQDRLARDVALQQQVFSTLAQALERAKLDEVHDTPVITILEKPSIPVRPESRRLAINGMVASFAFGFGGLLFGLGRDAMNRERRSGSPEVQEFDLLTASLLPLRRRTPRPASPSQP
jgi:uncharacterized protein involved in exopolysaccharide biosynthesis